MLFKNRNEAGQMLAKKLEKYKFDDNAVVYGLPRGGVVLAAEIASHLKCPLDLILSRKIGHPHNPEYAICAICENSPPICSSEVQHMDQNWLESEISRQREEIRRRKALYDIDHISPGGKTAIIVDDGIATGLTIEAAIHEVASYGPKSIVIAVPVTANNAFTRLSKLVDDFVCLELPQYFLGAVGSYYENFAQISDSEVVSIIKSFKKPL